MAEAKQPSVLTEVLAGMFGMDGESVQKARASQPSFGAEMAAMGRQGREDAWNALIPAFPVGPQATRESGTPGNPTQQQVTESLDGNEVDLKTDRIAVPEVTPAANEAAPRTADADIRKAVLGNIPKPQTPAQESQLERGRGR